MQPILNDKTLISLQILFRHGNRTPATSFPNDRYKDNKFAPFGPGNLTQKGKINSFLLGQRLRRVYGTFLGPDYDPEKVYSMTSGLPRAILTLQCVHAGLFPPKSNQQLVDGLTWQPIIYDTLDKNGDPYLAVHRFNNKWLDVERELTPEEKEIYGHFEKYVGMEVKLSHHYFNVQNALQVQKELGLEIPEWGKKYSSEVMLKHTLQFWSDVVSHHLPQVGGLLTQFITNNFESRISGGRRKLVLLSGHDVNLVAMLEMLGGYQKFYVEYCSFMAFELHEWEHNYYLRVCFQNGMDDSSRRFIPIAINGREPRQEVLFTDFVAATKWLYDPQC